MRSLAVLRAVAVLIGVAGLLDPVVTMGHLVRERLTIAVVVPSEAMHEAQVDAVRQLVGRLPGSVDAQTRVHLPGARAAACPSTGLCVVVSDGGVPQRMTAGATVVGALKTSATLSNGVRIAAVDAPRSVHRTGQSVVKARLQRDPDIDGRSTVQIFDSGVLVGQRVHQWTGGTEAEITVPWAPIDAGLRRLRIVAFPGDASSLDDSDQRYSTTDEVDVTVEVREHGTPILVLETEPTWMGTFVRRALERDQQFAVSHVARLGPGVAVSSDRRIALDALVGQVSTVVVSGSALTPADVDRLERFVSARGGSVVVLLDRAPEGLVRRLVTDSFKQASNPAPQSAGPLRASELVWFDSPNGATSVLERAGDKPVVVSKAIGRGRVIAVGALDAWRYRNQDFDRFWVTLVADAALAAGDPVAVRVEPALVMPGEEARVSVELKTDAELPRELSIAGTLHCPGGSHFIRFWPAARRGSFTGVAIPDAAGECSVQVSFTPLGVAATSRLLVSRDVRRVDGSGVQLEDAIAARGGVVVTNGSEGPLVDRIRNVTRRHAASPVRVMRSPWWFAPFAGCLAVEWWLRRRRGLR